MATDISGTGGFTNGPYSKPTSGDAGNDVFSRLEDFMDRMATHTHSGADSNKISLNIEKDVTDFTIGVDLTWTSLGDGSYKAAIAVPGATTFDASVRHFFRRVGAARNPIFPDVVRIDNNNYEVYVNDNTIELTVVTL